VFVNKTLDQLPLWPVVILATIFVLMPFGEPHLVSKMKMLRDGVPLIPIDWFDIVVHAGPVVIAAMKVRRVVQLRSGSTDQPDAE